MAKVTFSPSIDGIRGKLGRFVYRAQNGQTVVAAHYARKDKPTAAQLDRRARFKRAHSYAKEVLADPLKRDCYRKLAASRNCPPNALLISNFLNPPTIDTVDFSAYHGAQDSLIRVLATDAIEVVGVSVVVRGAAHETLESGAARKDHDVWVYRCTTSHASRAPVSVEITAENRAGAKSTRAFAPA
jgi:hypothetical protein